MSRIFKNSKPVRNSAGIIIKEPTVRLYNRDTGKLLHINEKGTSLKSFDGVKGSTDSNYTNYTLINIIQNITSYSYQYCKLVLTNDLSVPITIKGTVRKTNEYRPNVVPTNDVRLFIDLTYQGNTSITIPATSKIELDMVNLATQDALGLEVRFYYQTDTASIRLFEYNPIIADCGYIQAAGDYTKDTSSRPVTLLTSNSNKCSGTISSVSLINKPDDGFFLLETDELGPMQVVCLSTDLDRNDLIYKID